LEDCPNCEILKTFFVETGIDYELWDLSKKDSVLELRYAGIYVGNAPIIMYGKSGIGPEKIFKNGEVNVQVLSDLGISIPVIV
jgi:hypothetical protein